MRYDGCGTTDAVASSAPRVRSRCRPSQIRYAAPNHFTTLKATAEDASSDVNEAAHAEDGGEAGRTPLIHAAGDDVHHRRTRHEQQRERGGYKESERGCVGHLLRGLRLPALLRGEAGDQAQEQVR
jgi:hypothetical protein